jgi:hypothetical protein
MPPDASALSRCLAVQSWDPDAGRWSRYFIVPASDPDCDDIASADECDPLAAKFHAGPCVTPDPTDSLDPPRCVLGKASCEDGRSVDQTCAAPAPTDVGPRICVPEGLCSACASIFGVGACVVAAILDGVAAHLECKLDRDEVTQGPCVGAAAPPVRLTTQASCLGIATAPLGQAPLPASLPPFTTSASIALGGADLTLRITQGLASGCTIELVWKSGALAPQQAWFMLLVKTASGISAIPLLVDVPGGGGSCPAALTPCELRNLEGDSVLRCLEGIGTV